VRIKSNAQGRGQGDKLRARSFWPVWLFPGLVPREKKWAGFELGRPSKMCSFRSGKKWTGF
jgi:hypothetical protein